MRLFLLRHAEAEDDATSDTARCLTPLGVEQAGTVGRFCARVGITPELVLFSTYVRAEQTARAFADAWPPDARALQAAPFAASGMHPEAAMHELRAYERFASVMLVGHQPDLGSLVASLLGMRDPGAVSVGKAALIGLDLRWPGPGGGMLAFHMPVELMA